MSATRLVEVVFPNLRVAALAELLDEQAPQTCQLIWETLPIEETVYHCIRCGREVFALIPPLRCVPPPENRSLVPTPGDLWFMHFPDDYQYNPPGFRADKRGTFDLVIWYGPDSWALDPAGNMIAGTHWARIISNLDPFAKACEQIWLIGTERMLIRRAL